MLFLVILRICFGVFERGCGDFELGEVVDVRPRSNMIKSCDWFVSIRSCSACVVLCWCCTMFGSDRRDFGDAVCCFGDFENLFL